MDPAKMKDFAGRLQKGGKGAGPGIGLLGAAGALAFGLYKSMYTGTSHAVLSFSDEICRVWSSEEIDNKCCKSYYLK